MISYYYRDISKDGPLTNGKDNGIVVKRIYIHYDQTISERFDSRVTIEVNENNLGNAGNFEPYIKFAYIRWKSNSSFYL